MRGLTLSNKRYINKNYEKETVLEMSRKLKKSAALIENYIAVELQSKPLPDAENPSSHQEIGADINLRNRSDWIEFCSAYTLKELDIFEEKYYRYMKQFQNDVQPTEEQQIFQMIGLEIDMARIKASRKHNLDLKDKRLREISKEEKRGDEADPHKINSYHQEVLSLESANLNSSKELKDMYDRHNKLAEQLKGTREQRIKDATSGKISWMEVLRYWSDPKNREWEAKRIAAVNMAISKEKERLSSYHTYADNKVDRPILNTETNGDNNGS